MNRNVEIGELKYELYRTIEQEKCTMSEDLLGGCQKRVGHYHAEGPEAETVELICGFNCRCFECAKKKNAQITELEKALAKIDEEYIGPDETYDPYMTWSELAVENGRLDAEIAKLRYKMAQFATCIDFTKYTANHLLMAIDKTKGRNDNG